jgi:hypothetical protein
MMEEYFVLVEEKRTVKYCGLYTAAESTPPHITQVFIYPFEPIQDSDRGLRPKGLGTTPYHVPTTGLPQAQGLAPCFPNK